jgi:hypothetical protein
VNFSVSRQFLRIGRNLTVELVVEIFENLVRSGTTGKSAQRMNSVLKKTRFDSKSTNDAQPLTTSTKRKYEMLQEAKRVCVNELNAFLPTLLALSDDLQQGHDIEFREVRNDARRSLVWLIDCSFLLIVAQNRLFVGQTKGVAHGWRRRCGLPERQRGV